MSKFKRHQNKPRTIIDRTPSTDDVPYIERFCLPEEITLEDGRTFTNSEIVTLKLKAKYDFFFEEEETLKLILKEVDKLREIYNKEKE